MLVTVGMPVRNAAETLDRALNSLRTQTFVDLEIVVSDNASVDGTWEMLETHAAEDERIRLVRSHTDQGPVANFGRVLDLATGEAFMWAAGDDYWSPDFVRRLSSSLSQSRPYSVPNWWVGDIARCRGRAWTPHPVAFASNVSRRIRVLRYINMHHAFHKANVVYSLFNRDFLQEVYRRSDMANDTLLGANILSASAGQTVDDVLLWKDFKPRSSWRNPAMIRASRLIQLQKLLQRMRPKHERFHEQKERALQEHLRHFPEFSSEIREIFLHYTEVSVIEGVHPRITDLL